MDYEEYKRIKSEYKKEYEDKCKELATSYALKNAVCSVGDLITSQGKERGVVCKIYVPYNAYTERIPEAYYKVKCVGSNGKYKKRDIEAVFYQEYITDVKKAGTFKIKE